MRCTSVTSIGWYLVQCEHGEYHRGAHAAVVPGGEWQEITKGDGFVWLKRKHYFKPELNPQFFAKLLQEGWP